jgi:protein SCO1/2
MTTIQHKIISLSLSLIACLAIAGLIGLIADHFGRRQQQSSPFPSLATVEFDLPATTGERISNRDLLGRPVAMFYGFTHCPEVCPVTLYNLSEIIETIGEKAQALQLVFVTVDPERDTVAVLTEYINAVNEDAIGLGGDSKTLALMRKSFGIFAEKAPLDSESDHSDYTIDHTATVFLYDAEGKLSATIAWGEPYNFAEAKIRGLLKEN